MPSYHAHTEDYFALFDIAPSFVLDTGELHRRYISLQQQYHPDRLVGKSESERLAAVQKTATINDAYQTLKNPLYRAEYLLFQQGRIVNRDGKGEKPSQALLMESLEQREALGNAESVEIVTEAERSNARQREENIAALKQAFAASDYDRAVELTIRQRYLEKFAEEIARKKRKIHHEAA